MFIDNLPNDEIAIKAMLGQVGIAKVYSPPRCTTEARRWRLRPGVVLGLTTGWDFNLDTDRREARQLVDWQGPIDPGAQP